MSQECNFGEASGRPCGAEVVPGRPYCAFHIEMAGGGGAGRARSPKSPPEPAADESPVETRVNETHVQGEMSGWRAQRQLRVEMDEKTYLPPQGRSRIVHEMPTRHTEEPEVIGSKMARLMLIAEQQQMARKRRARRDEHGYVMREDDDQPPPMRVIPRRTRPDPTAIIDPITGRTPESLDPKQVHRWVRTVDWMDRPTESRVAEFEDYGYTFITDANGDPIESRFGVAMQGAPQQYAARVLDCMPTGAIQRDDALTQASDMADWMNERKGADYAHVTATPEHRSYRTQETVGEG